jgi:UDP-N-acetylmuramyl pentapeptide phosphotransferase/UDP-N-acetylglucosamine-1-phosphate transferase
MLGATLLVAFLVSFACLRLALGVFGRYALDRPNERSLHAKPVPRTGGIAVLAGALAAFAFGAESLWLPLALAGALAAVSLIDDLRPLPAGVRLAAHLAAAIGFVAAAFHSGFMEMAALALAVAWITNLYNFMDGADGIAGGMSLIGFGAYAVAAALDGDGALLALCAAIAAASAAFLVHNFHPARIFLGDVGSIPLGFLAAALGLLGWRDGHWPLWFPLVVFAPFIGDATLTLARRAARGERVWQAHREHYYQRLVRMGIGHRGTALIEYAAMGLCAAAALLGRTQPPLVQALACAAAGLVLAAAAVWVDLRWTRHQRAMQASA